MRFFALALTIACLAGAPARADQFIGVEAAPPAEEAESKADAKAEAKAEATVVNKAKAPVPTPGSIHGWGMIGGSRFEPIAQLTVSYFFNRFLSLDLLGHYSRFDRGDLSSEQYGPELNAVARLPNPLPITPFVGLGPGYVQWRRAYDGETFAHANSWTASVFGGLTLKFTKNFGLQATRRRLAFLQTPPIGFEDRKTREPKSRVLDQIGFVVTF